MKKTQSKISCFAGIAALLLAGAGVAQAQVPITNIINNFDTTPSSGNGIGREWGPGAATWDPTTDAGSGSGSELVTVTWDPSSDTPCVAFACIPAGNPWYNPAPINFSSYQTLEFDIKYDNTSDISISQFNDVSTWPDSLTNDASANQSVFQSWANGGTALAAGGQVTGLEINLCGGPAGQMGPVIFNTNMPATASNGWVHVVIPINQAQSQIDGVDGIVIHKWCSDTWTLATPVSARFWIDNVVLKGTTAPPPPPKLSVPTKASQGLAIFASSEGNSYYDRQEAELMQSSGLSWVGQATPANPVTYSFTITGYPNSVNCEAYLFMAPNPNANDNAPDWNETNCAIFYLQGNNASATAHFRYKINEDHQQAMYSGGNETRTPGGSITNNYYYSAAPGSMPGGAITNTISPGVYNITNESGDLATIANSSGVLGTWTIKFTSDTNGTIITPSGASTNFVIPPYNVGYFAEQQSPGFNMYLGMQANNADAMNQAVVYSNFAVSGTGTPFSENFLTDTVLDTTNVWRTSVSGGPQGVLIVPANSALWVNWTLPDSGFSLQTAPVLNNPSAWTAPTTGPAIALYGMRAQLVASNEVPAGPTAFFELIKRQFTQLQVLLPGETNAPNTATGKVGTPQTAPVNGEYDVTINAVDSTYHIVNSSDQLSMSTTDGSALISNGTPNLVNGTATTAIYFSAAGSYTVSATDTTNTNIPAATSSTITAQ